MSSYWPSARGLVVSIGRAGLVAIAGLSCAPPPDQPEPVIDEASRDGSRTAPDLVAGMPIERELEPGSTHHYSLDLNAGDFLHLVVNQSGIDVATTLLDPKGNAMIDVDRQIGYRGPEPLLAIAAATGTHSLKVRAFDADRPPGRYRLEMLARRPASDNDRLRAQAAALLARGAGLLDAGEPEEATHHLNRALRLWQEARDPFWQAETLSRLASAELALDHRQKAILHYERSAELFGDAGDMPMQATSLSNAATLLFRAGDIEKTIHYHRRALELTRTAGDALGEAISSYNLGFIYRNLGRMQDALSYYRRALDLWDDEREPDRKARTLHNIGVLYRILGQFELARDHLLTAERKAFDIEDRRGRAASLNQLGRLHLQTANLERALAYFREALELRRQSGDWRGEANTLTNIGLTHQQLGQTDDALKHCGSALSLLRDSENRRLQAKVLLALGSLSRERGRLAEAKVALREALELYRTLLDPAGEAESLLTLAAVEASRGELELARDSSKKALHLLEQVRLSAISHDLRSSFFSTVQPHFEAHIDLLMRLHHLEPEAGHEASALLTSERARARSFSEMLIEGGADIRRRVAPELLAREKALQDLLNGAARRRLSILELERYGSLRLEELEQELRQIAADLDAVRAEIRARSPAYAALTQPRPLTLDQIQHRLLDNETLLLEYQVAAKRSFLWVVAPDSVAAFELPGREAIEPLVRRAHELLSKSQRREHELASRGILCELSRMLLEPAAELLPGRRLILVVDEALQFLPFAALPDPTSHCADAAPLIVHHEIAYLPSASALAVLRQGTAARAPAPGLLAVVADPVYSRADERLDLSPAAEEAPYPGPEADDKLARRGPPPTPAHVHEPFQRLRFSRREAQAILEWVPHQLSRSAFDFAASKQSVLAGDLNGYQIAHFATHGVLNPNQSELSGIVLSLLDETGGEIDGFLRAHELYNLDLPAELVVLSACRTALGQETRGEGLVGMTRGFMYAGATRVLVSLWSVSDRSTSRLMSRFYRELLREGLAPAAALRHAQIAMWKERPSPFYWAAFVLQGEWAGKVGQVD